MLQQRPYNTHDYAALVSAFCQVITAPEETMEPHLKKAMELAADFDDRTIEKAKREAAVMAVIGRDMLA
jgi:hypothetical protein